MPVTQEQKQAAVRCVFDPFPDNSLEKTWNSAFWVNFQVSHHPVDEVGPQITC